jgi:hypothetical protein
MPGHQSGAIQCNRKILLATIAAESIHHLLRKFSESGIVEKPPACGFENQLNIAKIAVA